MSEIGNHGIEHMESGSFSERAEITPELEASYRDLFKDDFGDNVMEGHSPSIERPEDIRPEEGSLDEILDDLEKSYRDLFKDDFEDSANEMANEDDAIENEENAAFLMDRMDKNGDFLIDKEVWNEANEVDEDRIIDAAAGEAITDLKDRLNQTPNETGERGFWTGERGESVFIPSNSEIKDILAKFNMDGISYTNSIPDFSKLSECTLKIENMTDQRDRNFEQCDNDCAKKWNEEARDGRTDWTARDIQEWRKENGYTWHERNDRETCDLIPTKINDYFGHLGGVSECKLYDNLFYGDVFDE